MYRARIRGGLRRSKNTKSNEACCQGGKDVRTRWENRRIGAHNAGTYSKNKEEERYALHERSCGLVACMISIQEVIADGSCHCIVFSCGRFSRCLWLIPTQLTYSSWRSTNTPPQTCGGRQERQDCKCPPSQHPCCRRWWQHEYYATYVMY